ncbi:hypothetical protein [Puia sp.]|uniref:hypothetical protein n=1 Tax=Puia sp. TaxID=2045100 RepID=UPI002F422B08
MAQKKNSQEDASHSQEDASAETRLSELREMAEAAAALAADEQSFIRAVEAFRAKDAARFQAELSARQLLPRCRLICHFLCSKYSVFICTTFCKKPPRKDEELSISEIRDFALEIAKIARDEALLKRFVMALEQEDTEGFDKLITSLKLEPYCHQLCHWLSSVRCRLVCKEMCPQPPLITEISYIPTSQITTGGPGIGLGAGPSVPPGTTGPDAKTPGGAGDHPFGGISNIRGVFSIAAPFEYKVEFADSTAGPWSPVLQSITDYVWTGFFLSPYPRVPDAQGWYKVSEMGVLGPDYLTDWNTPADRNKTYYLRLTVRNAGLQEFHSPIIPARVDNGAPSKPVISLQLQAPDGTRTDLGCCEKIQRGNGNVLAITITAWDENFGHIGVALQGGCGFQASIFDIHGNPLSKTYNGNISDTGYPAPVTFLWDPWAAGIKPCCYLIVVSINDRTIVNNAWYGGYSNSNWQSITIA